jgi:hypothetical protein
MQAGKKRKFNEESYKNKEIRNFYQGTRKAREAQEKTTTYLRKKNSELIGNVEEKLKRWGTYFDEALNTDSYEEQVEDLESQESNEQELTDKEIEEELSKLKNNKNGIRGRNIKIHRRKIKQIWQEECHSGGEMR